MDAIVKASGPRAAPCLDDDQVLAYADGQAPEPLRAHVLDCALCRELVLEAARCAREARGAQSGDAPGSDRHPRTLREGQVLGERYEIVRFIARGGMGEVYEARDRELHERVALKTLSCTLLDNAGALERLKAEVVLARRVGHPHVCRILEFGLYEYEQRGRRERVPFLTMEFLEGRTLRQRITAEGRLAEGAVRTIAGQLVDGLKAIHAAGIVHRDLKSENVFLVGAEERAVIVDFGLATLSEPRQSRRWSSSGTIVGTLDYMAPEQLAGQRATPAFDVFAWGVLVFEMLVGEPPWRADSPMAAASARLKGPPVPPSRRTGVAPSWDRLVLRCLELEPGQRWPSMAEVGRQLAAPRPPRRRWGWLALAAAAAGLLFWSARLHRRPAAVGPPPRTSPQSLVGAPPVAAPPAAAAPAPARALPPAEAVHPKRPRRVRPVVAPVVTPAPVVAPAPPRPGSELRPPAPRPEDPDDVPDPFKR